MSSPRSVWLESASRPSFPPLAGDRELDVDVVVIGGGITGLTAGYLLQRTGRSVAVVEARTIAAGATGNTTGKVTSQHGLRYDQLITQRGEAMARAYAEANQAAIDLVEQLGAETGADSRFTRAPAFVYTLNPQQRDALEAEHAAAVRLGLPATLTTEVDLPFPVELALRFEDQAHIHAVGHVAGLAQAIADGGGAVFEGTRATKLEERGGRVHVTTSGGRIHAGHAVIATLLPFDDAGGFFAKTKPSRSYGIAARLAATSGPAIHGMHISIDDPSWSTRPWDDGGRPGVIVVGESHQVGADEADPDRWDALADWARRHFDVASVEYRWSAQDYITEDGAPYVGRSPRRRRTFVATGFGKWGLSNGTAAGLVLSELIQGREHPAAAVFDATRVGDPRTIARLIGDNLHVARHFIGDRVSQVVKPKETELEPDTGGIIRVGGRTVGGYRDPDGTLHAVRPTCTHLGCRLHWNGAERSWDCPCHGSRFSYGGDVLEGPAVKPLEVIDVDDDDRTG